MLLMSVRIRSMYRSVSWVIVDVEHAQTLLVSFVKVAALACALPWHQRLGVGGWMSTKNNSDVGGWYHACG